jgi:hypothetical protein
VEGDLASWICPYHVVTESEEEFEVFESVLSRKIAEDDIGKWLHDYYRI